MRIILILALVLSASTCYAIDLDKIAMIESSGCVNVIGYDGLSLGCHQITKPALADYNKWYGTNYVLEDMLNPKLSGQIAEKYLNVIIPHYLKSIGIKTHSPNFEDSVLICYNWGFGNFKNWYRGGADYLKLPKITQRYLAKYKLH